jgi:hypothetical protein
MPARDQDSEARRSSGRARYVKSVASDAASLGFAQQPLELRPMLQPTSAIERVALACSAYSSYSPMRRRPRARRLRSTARPPRVRLRTRKPWRRARRVLDGW